MARPYNRGDLSLTPGTRLGPYAIIAPLGVGGMGEVYRARDTTLNRDVAIKILPDSFSADADRVARFRREAQVLASLNHPHIAAIYGVEEIEGSPAPGHAARALVLELVEGDTLATRLRRGPLPVADALTLARQIADALEAAHERGIVHRDLKPANIIVTTDGVAKVLDFGLAKVTSADGPGADSSHSPTTTAHRTHEGTILGTAAYMSPEQAKGLAVDRRSDLWAFGAVLYEMLTGRRAFDGDGGSEILAHILTKEPDWQRLPADTPPPVVTLLRRCLEKDRKRRLDSAVVARLEIDEASSSSTAAGAAPVGISRRRAAAWTLATATAVASVTFGMARTFVAPAALEPATTSRFAITLPPSQRMPAILLDRDLAISPDGGHMVYRVGGSTAGGPLALRGLNELEGRLLPGVDNARSPFFSPDGRWIGFFATSELNTVFELKKISIEGGPPITIARNVDPEASASWDGDDSIIVADAGSGLLRVAAAGGEPAPLVAADPDGMTDYDFMSVLPEGRGVLLTVSPVGNSWFSDASDAHVNVLDPKTGKRKSLVRGSTPTYVPVSAHAGYLVYASAGTLFAARFDLDRLAIQGDPMPLVEDIAMAPNGAANYDVSGNGTLVYVPSVAAASRSLVWVDRSRRETPTSLPARAYTFLRLSPDGTQVALTGLEDRRIWIGDLRQGTVRRLTLGSSEDGWPIWTPDSRSIVFDSNRDGALNMYSQPADGSGPAVRLTTGSQGQFPNSMTRDGRHILAAEYTVSTGLDIVMFSPPAAGPAPGEPAMPFVLARPLVKTRAGEYNAIASPDGRLFAYQSNESGRTEVYVKPLSGALDVRWQVSTSGGSSPVWAPKSRELYYRDVSGAVIAVPFETSGATWRAGTPTKVIDAQYATPSDMFNYDVSPDGQQFLMLKDTGRDDQKDTHANIVVVLNWAEELKRRLPAR